MLKALGELKRENISFHLNIIGKDKNAKGRYAKYLMDLAKKIDIQNSVTFSGYLPESEVSAALQEADFGILPFKGGVGLKSCAMAAFIEHDLPSIVTKSDENEKAIISDGKITIKPNSIKLMKEAIKRFIAQPDMYKEKLVEYKRRNPGDRWEELADIII